jgi:hypothetical protein
MKQDGRASFCRQGSHNTELLEPETKQGMHWYDVGPQAGTNTYKVLTAAVKLQPQTSALYILSVYKAMHMKASNSAIEGPPNRGFACGSPLPTPSGETKSHRVGKHQQIDKSKTKQH